MLHRRPDLAIGLIRGNVQTRLDRVAAGDFAATLLALAGLRRLGLDQRASLVLNPEVMVPSAGQGIVGVTVREADTELCALLASIEDPVARAVSTAERSMLAVLDGSCHTPIGGHARIRSDGRLRLTGLTASEDGSFLLKRSLDGLRATRSAWAPSSAPRCAPTAPPRCSTPDRSAKIFRGLRQRDADYLIGRAGLSASVALRPSFNVSRLLAGWGSRSRSPQAGRPSPHRPRVTEIRPHPGPCALPCHNPS